MKRRTAPTPAITLTPTLALHRGPGGWTATILAPSGMIRGYGFAAVPFGADERTITGAKARAIIAAHINSLEHA